MKKAVLLAVLSLTFASSAAWEKVGTLQLAGAEAVSAAAAELGGFTGNPLVGMMIATKAAQLSPFADFFGPARAGAAVLFPIFVEQGKAFRTPAELLASWEYAVLYPLAEDRTALLKRHPGAVETNGLWRVRMDDDDFDDDIDDSADYAEDEVTYNYIAFSADGKWAAMSDKPEQVRLALGEVQAAEKPMGGDLVRVRLLAEGVEVLKGWCEKTLSAATDDRARANLRRNVTLLGNVQGGAFSLAVGAKGIDVKGALRLKGGTAAAVLGKTALESDALGFAATNAVVAQALAANAPFGLMFDADVDFSDLNEAKLPGGMKDLPVDLRSFRLRVASEKGKFPLLIEGVEKDAVTKPSLAARFAKTLPELSGKPLFSASAVALVPAIAAILPEYLSKLSRTERMVVGTSMKLLPKNSQTAVAAGAWREKDVLRLLLRLPADEIRAICLVVGATMAQAELRMRGIGGGAAPAENED